MNLNDVHRGIKKNKGTKRLGRGKGSGQGKTAGRGHKGQGSRSGWSQRIGFEGGQFPTARRVGKRGFNNRFALDVRSLNLDQLQRHFEAGEEVSPTTLRQKGVLTGQYDELKILARGELTKKIKVSAHRFSQTALDKIKQAGGEVVVLPGKAPVVKNKMGSAAEKRAAQPRATKKSAAK